MASRAASGSFASGASVYLISNILVAGIPFILLPILTRHLEPREYGEIAMFQVMLGGLSAVVGLSVDGAAVRKYFERDFDGEAAREYMAACLQILAVSTLVVFVLVFPFRGAISSRLELQEHWVLWSVVAAAASVVVQLRLGQWMVRKQVLRYGALQVVQAALNLGLSIILVVGLHLGANGRIAGQVVAVLVMAAIAMVLLRRDRLAGFLVSRRAHLVDALRFGVPLVPHIVGIYLLSTVDRFVINAELGLSQTGIYLVAVQLSAVMSLVFDAVNRAYVPWLFEQLNEDSPSQKRRIVRLTYAWYGLIVLAVALAFAAGPWVVSIVAGSAYEGAGELVGWLCLGQGFAGMYLMVTNYVFFSKRTGLLSVVTIVSGALNVVLLLVLIKPYGLRGAVAAFCIAMATRFLLTWWVAQRQHPMPWWYFAVRNN